MDGSEIFDKDGNKLHIGDVINSLSPETLDNVVCDLDDYARAIDGFIYGLPNCDEKAAEMREVVKCALNRLTNKKT